MSGHRRISTELFLEYANDPVQAWKVAALLSLDHDEYKGEILSVSAYARIWGKNRVTVRKLISVWEAHRKDLYNAEGGDRQATGKRQASDTQGDTQNAGIPDTSVGSNDTQGDRQATGERQASDTFLEPEPEPEGGERPARSPSAFVGVGESRQREAKHTIRKLLAKRPPEPAERRAEIQRRLEILAAMYLASGGRTSPSAAWLSAAMRDTREIPTQSLLEVCDRARRRNDRGFVPSPNELERAWSAIRREARRRAGQVS